MGMNPDTNRFEPLTINPEEEETDSLRARVEELHSWIRTKQLHSKLVRPNEEHWAVFQIGEQVVIKNYTFKVAYIGETAILFEPVRAGDGK